MKYIFGLRNLNYEFETNNYRSMYNKNRNIFIYQEFYGYPKGEKPSVENDSPFNYMHDTKYLKLIDYMNTHKNFSLYINQLDGLTSDYILVQGKCFNGIKEMKKFINDAYENNILDNMKYQIITYIE